MNKGCLDESTVVAFLGGSLPAPERGAVEGHIGACAACADLTTWAAADIANRSRSVGREGPPFIGQLTPGSRVDRYQVLAAIGRGGMGEVYAAYHPDLDRRIALKVVTESGANAPERRARLLREARAIARLSHPNVVTVHDAGTFGDRVYIAMEFVAGQTVDQWLKSGTRSWREILDVFVAAGRGLEAAHEAGVIHRDFKPQNIMAGKDGSVRVMDFGLARLAEEPMEGAAPGVEHEERPAPATVTKTGALVGTLAYMAPEQFRGETIDARADQFSFCVALHEAVYGRRPTLSQFQTAEAGSDGDTSNASSSARLPAWLRSTIARGLSPDPEGRFPSMGALLASITRAQSRTRRRMSALGIASALVLLSIGGWRLASAGRVSCAAPKDRLAAVWLDGDEQNPRRQTVHGAFVSSKLPTAETSWQRVSRMLDAYVREWSAMYVQTCEATHVRGEQSAEVLDLRMSCLNDNLDQVHALTNVLADTDAATLGRAVFAAQDLTPVARCADVALLRSAAVPLPRDQRTLELVRDLRSSLREAQALRDVASFHKAYDRAVALRPRVEATGYKPLLGELLELIGCSGSMGGDQAAMERVLHEALFTAEAAHDDATAARVATDLILVTGNLDKPAEAEMWLHLADAILDRLGSGQDRIRAWARHNFGAILSHSGDLVRAERSLREAIALKERALGRNHPDVAITLETLSGLLEEVGRPAEALSVANRALEIMKGGDPDSDMAGMVEFSKGQDLVALGRADEAEAAFANASRILRRYYGDDPFTMAGCRQGLGDVRLAQGKPVEALALLEEVLRIREAKEKVHPYLVAETRFSVARALWDSGGNRTRATGLARKAMTGFAAAGFARRERIISDWLQAHKLASR